MIITKEFIQAEEKYLPLHLTKINYGFASTSAIESKTAIQQEFITLTLRLPVNANFVASLVIEGQQDITSGIKQIKVCPFGSAEVVFNIYNDNNTYNLYITSKEYENGFVTRNLDVIKPNENGIRYSIGFINGNQVIELIEKVDETTVGLEIKPNENNGLDWYNFQGVYSSATLNWSVLGTPSNYTYYIDYKRLVLNAIDIFKKNSFTDAAQNVNTLSIALNAIKSKVEIVQLYNDNIDVIQSNKEIDDYFKTLIDPVKDQIYLSAKLHESLDSKFVSEFYGKLYMTPGNAQHFHEVQQRILANFPNNTNPELVPMYQTATNLIDYIAGVVVTDTGNQGSSAIWNESDTVRDQADNFLRSFFGYIGEPQSGITRYLTVTPEMNGAAIYLQDYTRGIASEIYPITYSSLLSKMNQINDVISTFGDFILTDKYTGQTEVQVGHLATLQNIRFLKNKMTEFENDMWDTSISTYATMSNALDVVTNELNTKLSTINSLQSIVPATNVNQANISIFYTPIVSKKNSLTELISPNIIDIGNGLYSLRLPEQIFGTIGNYYVVVTPLEIEFNVINKLSNGILVLGKDILGDNVERYQADNALYGWTLRESSGNKIFTIVSSNWAVDGIRIKISPEAMIGIEKNTRVKIAANDFIPLLFDVKIKRHNEETLSYSNYGKKEFNTETGLCTIYDYAGNVYKQFSIGTRALSEEDKTIIEFRNPI